MSIFTSRYSNKELRKEGYYPVGISLGTPKFPLGYELRGQCYTLAPKRNMLQLEYEEYKTAYTSKLDDIGASNVIRIVNDLEAKARAEEKDLVLLCFEDVRDPEKWCHRTMFAEWWLKHTGEVVNELIDESPCKALVNARKAKEKAEEIFNPYEQLSLF